MKGSQSMASYVTMSLTDYTYDTSGRLIRENLTETYNDFTSVTRDILYLYDESGIVGAVQTYNSTTETFYFDRNIKGDVIGIYNASGTKIANYSYDSWGNQKVTTYSSNNFSGYNPIRYRGYYFDAESGFYFLNARYYNPAWRRFISPDDTSYLDPETPNGLNLYAYCNNDPVNYSDPSGHFALTTFGIWAIVGIVSAAVLFGGVVQLASNALAGETGSELWRGVAGAALGSGANALALCLSPFTGGASFAFAAVIGAGVQTGVDTLETLIRGEKVKGWQTAVEFGINFVTTLAGNWLGAELIPTNSGWFKPQKFFSIFTKPYGQKILLQTAIGAGLSGIVNFARKFDWSSMNWKNFILAMLFSAVTVHIPIFEVKNCDY